MPISGGYFRLYPAAWMAHWLGRVNRQGQPFMFYVHPWEIDPEQPRLLASSRLDRWRHYVNLTTTWGKLDGLLTRFRFGRMDEVLSGLLAAADGEPVLRREPARIAACA